MKFEHYDFILESFEGQYINNQLRLILNDGRDHREWVFDSYEQMKQMFVKQIALHLNVYFRDY